MNLRSRVDITVGIDDKSFSITVSNLTKEQAETIKNKHGDFEADAKRRSELSKTLKNKIERYGLLKTLGRIDEALTLLDEIEVVENDLGVKHPQEAALEMSALYQTRFLMMVSGQDKDAMRAYIDERNINYYDVMTHIEDKALEGK